MPFPIAGGNISKMAYDNANEAINKSNEAANKAEEAKGTAETVRDEFDRVVAEAGENNPEVVQARGEYVNLNARLDDTTAQLAQTARKLSKQNAEIIAHRGLNSLANEQTLLAFRKAYEYGIKSWECDVQVTSDGELILVHDKTLLRTTGDSRVVSDVPYSDIKNLDSSILVPYYSPSYIPTFDQFLKLAKATQDVIIYPEISPFQYSTETKQRTVNLIVENGLENRCVIQSFNFNDLNIVRNISKVITLGYLCSNLTNYQVALPLASEDGNADILIDYNVVLNNPQIVKECANQGVGIACWTVNNIDVVRQLQEIGISRFMTDSLIGGYVG